MSPFVSKILLTDQLSIDKVLTTKKAIYTFLNPVSYLSALDHKELFSNFDGIFTDGSFLVKAIKAVYGKSVKRRSFDMTSMAPELLKYIEESGKTIYLVASHQRQIEKAVEIFRKRYPKLKFAGYRNGYFSSNEELDEEVRHIVNIGPDFLIVGMGTLMQERFLLRIKNADYQGIGFTCGGFIHQLAQNKKDFYPKWINRHDLRFIYRMYKEPHTRKRYAKAAFLFPVRFLFVELTGK